MERIIVIGALSVVLAGCATTPIPVMVNATQTEIATTGATLAGDIATVKEITDTAKATGEIPKAAIPTIIKYVDKSYAEVTKLNALVKKQTENTAKLEQSRIKLQLDSEKYRRYLAYSLSLNGLFFALLAGYILRKLKITPV